MAYFLVADGERLAAGSEVPAYDELHLAWRIAGALVSDPQRIYQLQFDPDETVPPTVSPPTYMLLFTSAERVAIKAKRASDPVLSDFFDVIDDPRLTEVVLSLQSVQDGTSYALQTAGVAAEEIPVRLAQILTGVLQ